MGGFAGIGGSSAKTDRGNQLAATQGNWNIFNWSLPQGQAGQATGQQTLASSLKPLDQAQQYFSSLLTAGRTETAQNSAPAIQNVLDSEAATRNSEGRMGTARVGGTAAINREAGAQATSSIDQIINQNLVGEKAAGAAGLAQVAGQKAQVGIAELSNSLKLLGLSEESINSIMDNATKSRPISQDINEQVRGQWETVIKDALGIASGFGSGGSLPEDTQGGM